MQPRRLHWTVQTVRTPALVGTPAHATRRRLCRGPCAHLVGIDLGTTNSSVAVLGDRGPLVIAVDEDGRRSVPSVVALGVDGEGDVLTLQDWDASRGDVFYSFKRIIGLRPEEISPSVRECLRYDVLANDTDEATPGCVVSYGGGNTTTPIALSSAVVRHLIEVSSAYYGGLPMWEGSSENVPIEGAVIAVPAHFTPSQKQATINAAQIAGIHNVHLLQEPVAAALAYGIDGGTDGETVLVFDWGGGTFDVSVLQAFEGIMEILGTDGNQFLGGDDIDQLLVESIAALDAPLAGPDDDAALRAACRNAKEALAEADVSRIYVEGAVDTRMTRDDLERLCEPLFEEIATVLDRIGKDLFIEWRVGPFDAIAGRRQGAYQINHMETETHGDGDGDGDGDGEVTMKVSRDPWAPPPRKITKVVLVGQITRLQMVVDYIHRVTGIEPDCSVDPGEAVAIGAATQAGILDGSVGSVELMDGSYSIDLHDRTTGFSNWQP